MRFFVTIDNATAGPFDHLQLLQLRQAGVITSETQCRADDQNGSWQSLYTTVPSVAWPAVNAGLDRRVSVSDLKMKFGSMMLFMIKWVFASIPAFFIVLVLLGILGAVFAGMFAGLLGGLQHAVK